MGLLLCFKVERRLFSFFLYFWKFEKKRKRDTEMMFATSVIAVLMSLALADGRRCYWTQHWSYEMGFQREFGDKYCWKMTQNFTANMAWSNAQRKNTRLDQSGKFRMSDLLRRENFGRFVCKDEREGPGCTGRVVRYCVMICDTDLCNNWNARPRIAGGKEQKAKNIANSFASVNKST